MPSDPQPDTTAAAAPAAPAPDVQSAPHGVQAGAADVTAQIKVDVAVRDGALVVVAGWCTAALPLQLGIAGQPCTATRCAVDRPDVRQHFGLPDSLQPGFALLVEDAGEGPITLQWAAGDGQAPASSAALELSPATTLRPSQQAALGALAQRLHAPAASPDLPADGAAAALAAAAACVAKARSSPARREARQPAGQAFIVGSSADLDLRELAGSDADIFALNGAYFHLQAQGIEPFALVTGDRRFLVRHGLRQLDRVRKIVAFDYVLDPSDRDYLSASTIVETFPCRGRDGFSTDPRAGFFHGCSSFFLAVQYLASQGYKRVSTLGVKFPPPELYSRVNANVGQPEFVYGTQLNNLVPLRAHLGSAGIAMRCRDSNSNLALFL